MKKTPVCLYLWLWLLPASVQAQGGMWLPLHLEKQNEKEMRAMGLKRKADDLYAPNRPSIKDAICQFSGGCTAEVISAEGLLLTNHHCAFSALQRLSSLERNYVEEGFWARSREEELPCPGETATFVVRMEDVTALALQHVTEGMSERDRQSQIDKNIAQIRANARRERWQEAVVRPFYHGNQYFLFITETYTDLRLVGAPPSSIGKFGADTDNWVWPRHTGDFALFRIYADKDNRPAPYSPENRPLRPKYFLPISLSGVEEGDFTMVYGFPGRTDEYLPASAVHQIAEVLNPTRIAIREQTLKILDRYMRSSPAIKIAYVARYASLANAWKKWLGERQGLRTYGVVGKKQAYEAEFTRRISNNPTLNVRYRHLLPRLNETYREIEPYAEARENYLETFLRNIQITAAIANVASWLAEYEKGQIGTFSARKTEIMERMRAGFTGYYLEVDRAVFAALVERYAQTMRPEWGGAFVRQSAEQQGGFDALALHLFATSVFTDSMRWNNLMSLPTPDSIARVLQRDPFLLFWRGVSTPYNEIIGPKWQELQGTLSLLQRQYMAAQLEVFKERRFFPDANGTLRLTYGQVRGYSPRDAVRYEFRTHLDGVMEKYIPGDYEFDVPQRLIDLWKAKDFGPYATRDGRMPVAFIATNHTTGGNSGSPALDAYGNLVGLNFDRVWEGTMSDLYYDPAICRNIMVDVRYILFILDKYAGASHLLKEMKLVKTK
ncbi:MAG: S46 family peptidase [Saprospiraceae bacterium]|nr:S46 family peptidase [Saprospiraceae bacterium]MDW8485306.1 S46 family peptidase [Saprospiraceae bacterium]